MPKNPTKQTADSTAILQGSERPKRIAKPGDEISSTPLDTHLDIRVSIQRRTPLPALSSRGVKTILNLEDYEKTYGATDDDINAIKSFAKNNGLKVEREDAGERAVWISGTAGQFNKAFKTELKQFKKGGDPHMFRIREGSLWVPAHLVKIIDSVDGLTDEPFANIQFRARAMHPAAAGQNGFTPIEVARHYNFPINVNGAGQTIGIIELGGGFAQAELDSYFTGLGLHPIPSPVIVPVLPGGGTNNPGADPDSDGEVALDIEVIGAIAPGAQLVVYFAPDASGQSFLDILTAAIHDSVNRPTILSISWGGPEQNATQQFMEQFDDALQTAAQLGITVCVATGDSASADFAVNDPAWDRHAHVDFPASSPFALACGGTEITSDSEVVWNSGPNEGTGGGISRYFPLPDYQRSSSVPKASNPTGPVRRGIPDVSGNAAPESGYQILVDGAYGVIGGTSAVAPLWSALTALLNQALGKRHGFLNPLLYQIGNSESTGFTDITIGNNGDYQAGPGWDPCTGLGAPNGNNLLQALQKADGLGVSARAALRQHTVSFAPHLQNQPTSTQIDAKFNRCVASVLDNPQFSESDAIGDGTTGGDLAADLNSVLPEIGVNTTFSELDFPPGGDVGTCRSTVHSKIGI